jgi:hypothetical protein
VPQANRIYAETYTQALLLTGQPNDAFDTAAIIRLADYHRQ